MCVSVCVCSQAGKNRDHHAAAGDEGDPLGVHVEAFVEGEDSRDATEEVSTQSSLSERKCVRVRRGGRETNHAGHGFFLIAGSRHGKRHRTSEVVR